MDYIAKDFFILRVPIFSVNNYQKLVCNENAIEEQLLKWINDNVFMEGIAIASPDLYSQAIRVRDNKTLLADKSLYMSLLKYAIRACTRTIPFGLFAGISFGNFASHTNIVLSGNCSKRARTDMEWIRKVIVLLENDIEFMQGMALYSNEMAYKKGGRLYNPYVIDKSKTLNLNVETASIRYTELLEHVMIMCKDGKIYHQIISDIQKKQPEASNEKIINYLQSLLHYGFLISELRVAKSNLNPLENLKTCLKKSKSSVLNIKNVFDIEKNISIYNATSPGNGLVALKKIEQSMKSIVDVKNYIQVDYKAGFEQCLLSNNVKKRCEHIADKLVKLGMAMPELDYLQRYKQIFNEKYGPYREIALLDLLDEERGIGAPEGYMMPKNKSTFLNITNYKDVAVKKMLKELITSKVLLALKNNNKEVVLTDDDLLQFNNFSESSNTTVPQSIDMFFYIFADDKKDIDNDKFELAIAPSCGVDISGRTIGRFSDMFNVEEKQKYNELFIENKKALEDEFILVDLVEEPTQGRIGNVILNDNIAEYQTALGCVSNRNVKQIPLKDILVGLDFKTNKFYLKSCSLNKKVKYVLFNMLNPLLGSNIRRFLGEISSIDGLNFARLIRELSIKEFAYIPQIKYSNCILMPSTWNLSIKQLGYPRSYNEFKEEFKKWSCLWNVPDNIYYKKGDDLLRLNLENKYMLEELYKILIKKKEIELVEYENASYWVKNNKNEKYISEFVFSLYSRKINNKKSDNSSNAFEMFSEISKNQEPLLKEEENRISITGEDGWWYFKLYGTALDSIIVDEILPFYKKNQDEENIEQFYFIRYADPSLHIRLRIKLTDKNKDFNSVFMRWLKNLKYNNLIKEYTINIYERELERYGGSKAFKYAEEVFYYDSLYVAELLDAKRAKDTDEKLVVMSNLLILNEFTLDLQQQLKLFEVNYGTLTQYKKEFKKNSKEYIKIYETLETMAPIDYLELSNRQKYNQIKEVLKRRNTQLKKYFSVIKCLDTQGELANSYDDIILSIMHMHCNRFNGNRIWETKTIEFTYRTIYAFKNYKFHVINREKK